MAYDPTIPALNNYIGDDIPKIMANFAELAGSRIVDHNLDVANPPNGHYVRWDNGLKVCWYEPITIDNTNWAPDIGIDTEFSYGKNYTWTYPAGFASTPSVVVSNRR